MPSAFARRPSGGGLRRTGTARTALSWLSASLTGERDATAEVCLLCSGVEDGSRGAGATVGWQRRTGVEEVGWEEERQSGARRVIALSTGGRRRGALELRNSGVECDAIWSGRDVVWKSSVCGSRVHSPGASGTWDGGWRSRPWMMMRSADFSLQCLV